MALAPEQTGIGIRRHFTSPDVDPYDMVEWERRDARITNFRDGSVAFEQLGVEVPSTWSVNATNILAQKYFRGTLGTPERERSLKQVADRVTDTIVAWGQRDGYFVDDDEAETFRAELKYLIITQRAAFNSPVWFNIGVEGVPQQASACFILSVDDTMDSILNWYVEEGTIFKGGSGAGINLSRIRSSKELLKGGGEASGPVSFMRGADASAGTIKSGGKTRRAAKMVILDVGHPDIEEFIWCKAREEQKARVLRDAGFDMDLDGADSHSTQYQNANNSVRVTDDFMQAVVDDADWHLRGVMDGEILKTVRARDLMRQISQASWECADPGMQFDTTINRWHTAANTGRINGSNPCCFVGETLVDTTHGLIRFDQLQKMADAGDELPEARTFDLKAGRFTTEQITKVWVAGETDELVEVRTERGLALRCTKDHRFLTREGRYVEARSLTAGTALRSVDDEGTPVGDKVASVTKLKADAAVKVYDLEVRGTHNFGVTAEGSSFAHSVVVHNSEYMHLDNSACNLASLNLLKFLDDGDGDTFDVEGFKSATKAIFTAQEILVGNADYPTGPIGDTSRRFRQLGIGYANLGALLMAMGLAYDSDGGRAWAGAITALLTGHSYATSAVTAARMGPFAGYAENEEHMLRVLNMHREAAAEIDETLVPAELLSAAQQSWDEACDNAAIHGVRNSQASVLAPTGTIGLLMDCDTTGIEPDLGLVKTKKLVGGGTMSIVNQTIPRALRRLGYTPEQIDVIVAHIDENKTILGAPELKSEHIEVFACSMGDNTIHYSGHVRMMAAAQPFLSGAISKTVNLPEEATVEEVEQLHIDAWQLGLKAVALYRDNCKVAQPLATTKKEGAAADAVQALEAVAPSAPAEVVERIVEKVIREPVRKKLPRTRTSRTFEFRVADCKGFATVGEYDDGRPGEIFVRVSKQGSTLAGIMDAFAISISHGLQYGVPLRAFVEAFTNMRFEPAGMTDDDDIRFASSLMDFLFRKLALAYLSVEERNELGIHSISERMQPTLPGVEESVTQNVQGMDMPADPPSIESASALAARMEAEVAPAPVAAPAPQAVAHADAPMCMQCGVAMQRAGSCHACPSCGSTSGCS
jgi:ribonucleotide reductase alpha subunit